jgi:hypothetical protein
VLGCERWPWERLRIETRDPLYLYRVDVRTRLCCCREDGGLVGDEALRHICRGKTTSGDDEAASLVLVTAVISACRWRIRLSFMRIGQPCFAASLI